MAGVSTGVVRFRCPPALGSSVDCLAAALGDAEFYCFGHRSPGPFRRLDFVSRQAVCRFVCVDLIYMLEACQNLYSDISAKGLEIMTAQKP
jgi:hypothetical protein